MIKYDIYGRVRVKFRAFKKDFGGLARDIPKGNYQFELPFLYPEPFQIVFKKFGVELELTVEPAPMG